MILPLVLLAATVLATGAQPALSAAFRLPALTGRVVDNADLLAMERERLLAWALAETERTTKHQFVVVTLPSLEGNSIEQVGLALGKGWGIGRKDHNDGVLLIVAPNERRVRIEVGLGLEKALTNTEAKAIIDQQMLPRFRKGGTESGILAGSAAIIRQIDVRGATP